MSDDSDSGVPDGVTAVLRDGLLEIDARGPDAKDRARTALATLGDELDGDITRIAVEVETTARGACDHEQMPLDDALAAAAAGPETETGTETDADAGPEFERVGSGGAVGPKPRADDANPTGRPAPPRRVNDADREYGDFQVGSAFHVVASYIDARDGAVRRRDAADALDRLPRGTVDGAFTDLYKRRVVDRRAPRDDEGEGTRYYLTDHGRRLLAEKGRATQTEWANA